MEPSKTVIAGINMMLPGMEKIGRLNSKRQIYLDSLSSMPPIILVKITHDSSHEEFLEQCNGREYTRDIAFTFDEVLAYIGLILVDPTGYMCFRKAGGPHIEGDRYFFYLVSEIDDQLYVGQMGRWIAAHLGARIDEWTLNAHTMDTYPPKQGSVFIIKAPGAIKPAPIEFSRSFARQVNDASTARTSKIAA